MALGYLNALSAGDAEQLLKSSFNSSRSVPAVDENIDTTAESAEDNDPTTTTERCLESGARAGGGGGGEEGNGDRQDKYRCKGDFQPSSTFHRPHRKALVTDESEPGFNKKKEQQGYHEAEAAGSGMSTTGSLSLVSSTDHDDEALPYGRYQRGYGYGTEDEDADLAEDIRHVRKWQAARLGSVYLGVEELAEHDYSGEPLKIDKFARI
jgi:hypothetical protein